MSKVKYRGTSFDEWKRANGYTADTTNGISQLEGMSDADYSIGQKLYNAYIRDQEAKAAHDTSVKNLTDDKEAAIASAAVSYDRLKKYLPQQLAKQGLYGTGVSEDAYLCLRRRAVVWKTSSRNRSEQKRLGSWTDDRNF